MKAIALFASLVCVASLAAEAEMPVTTVTPDNANQQEVAFSVTIEPQQPGGYSRVWLEVSPRTAKYGKVGQPGLYLYRGTTWIGHVALYSVEEKKGKQRTFWCDLAQDRVAGSTISVPCYPVKPTDDVELCAQSMQYTLKLKDFMKRGGSPTKADARDGR